MHGLMERFGRTSFICRRGLISAATLLALITFAAAPARSDDDKDFIRQVRVSIAIALNDALERGRSDRPISWNNPSSSLTGLITVYPVMIRNNRNCRSFKYVVSSAVQELTDTGLYCRDPAGLWSSAGLPDIVDTRQIDRTPPRLIPSPQQTTADTAPQRPPDQVQPNPFILQLQKNLVRLAYIAGPADGLPGPDFETALQSFQNDEGIVEKSDSDAIRRAISTSAAAIARVDRTGTCETPEKNQGDTLVCGRRR